MSSRLATSVCGISLKNPVLAASGTYGYGVEFEALVDLSEVGGDRGEGAVAGADGRQSRAAPV